MYCGLYSECPLREVSIDNYCHIDCMERTTCIRVELRQYLNNLGIFTSGSNDVSIYQEGIGMNNFLLLISKFKDILNNSLNYDISMLYCSKIVYS